MIELLFHLDISIDLIGKQIILINCTGLIYLSFVWVYKNISKQLLPVKNNKFSAYIDNFKCNTGTKIDV